MTGKLRQQSNTQWHSSLRPGVLACLQRMLLLIMLLFVQPGQAQDTLLESSAHPALRVVLIGHLYSLLVEKHSRDAKPFHVEEHLALLIAEIDTLKPDAVFLLGDVTNNASADEWTTIEKAFAGQSAPVHIIPGNHDLTAGLAAFRKNVGQGSRSVILEQTKFILLGNESFPRQLPNPELADFIGQQLEDHADYSEVVILMHFLLKGNPFWEQEIVPLLKGRVEQVFTGDLVRQHVKAQTDSQNGIRYVSSSIRFKGEGPPIFLVLDQTENGLRAVPHALPLDLTQAWYEDEKDIETSVEKFFRRVKMVPTKMLVAALVMALIMGVLSVIGLRSLIRKTR